MRRVPVAAGAVIASLVVAGLVYAFMASATVVDGTGPNSAAGSDQPSTVDGGRAAMSTASASPTVSASTPARRATTKLLFGIGTEATSAETTRLVKQSPARMLTSWYNGPGDLSWMTGWRTGTVPRAYASGYAMHLVVYSNSPEGTVNTSYGAACGRAYPLSDRFLDDMRALARTFAGSAGGPPLYVTLFTELQTYACTDNAWNPDAGTSAYYRALKDRYLAAMAIFHAEAANAKVSLGWGGWQTRNDNAATGGGRSMFGYFADVMRASDFQSFQAMQSDTNVADVKAMVHTLGAYGPVMLAHYKPDNGSQATFDKDILAMLTDGFLGDVMAAGLFAWSFMDESNLTGSESTYRYVLSVVGRYART
jgi:hypothetical protein